MQQNLSANPGCFLSKNPRKLILKDAFSNAVQGESHILCRKVLLLIKLKLYGDNLSHNAGINEVAKWGE